MSYKIYVLLYAPRSGSTLFSRLMSSCFSDLLVLPEFRFLEFLFGISDAEFKAKKANELYDLLATDPQLTNLSLKTKDLEEISSFSVGKDKKYLFDFLIKKHCEKLSVDVPSNILVKLDTYIYYLEDLKKFFGDINVIYIYRDPRGVVNSTIKSLNPYRDHQMMGRGDVFYTTMRWKKYCNKTFSLKEKYNIEFVKYESLCMNYMQCMKKISENLNLKIKENDRDTSSAYQISPREEKLHRLVQEDPVPTRTDGWKSELNLKKGVVVEVLCRNQMKYLDYEFYFYNKSSGFQRFYYFASLFPVSIKKNMHYYFERFLFYSKNRSVLKVQARVWMQRIVFLRK